MPPSSHSSLFVEAFVGAEPATRSAILERAVTAGLSQWRADQLLRTADSDGLMVRTGGGKRSEPYLYAVASGSEAGEEQP